MKKLLVLMIALVCIPVLMANPIEPPPASIELSEIAFENNGNWVIELQSFNYYGSNEYKPIDSIFICSSSGRSKINRFKIVRENGILIIRNDSLLSNLTINPISDSISLTYFRRSYSNETTVQTSPVVYGNFVTATLCSPKTGQSIAAYGSLGLYNFGNYMRYLSEVYSLDMSPTIGLANDSTGMPGTLKGNIYDSNNQLITATDLTYYGTGFYDILPNADGSYSTRIFSYKHRIDRLYYNSGTNKFIIEIEPINVSVQPDTVVTADIHILKITGIDPVNSKAEPVIRIYPNPLTASSFKYEISIPVKSANSYIELINMTGQQIARYSITDDKGKIELPAHTANGTYTLRLFVNNKNFGTLKIILAHK